MVAAFAKIRAALDSIPKKRRDWHLAQFARMIDNRLANVGPDLKYRYLDSAIKVIGEHEDMEDAVTVDGPDASRTFSTSARLVESLGSEIIVHFGLDAEPYVVADAIDDEAEKGLSNDLDTATFVARISPRSPVRNSADIDLVIDAERFHFFDITSGNAIR